MGLPIAADIAHTSNIVKQTRLLFLCFAYFIGCVTAIYLKSGGGGEEELLVFPKKCSKSSINRQELL